MAKADGERLGNRQKKLKKASTLLDSRGDLHRIARLISEALLRHLADIAQLVERDLAKVEVTSSNLVIRSKFLSHGLVLLLNRR